MAKKKEVEISESTSVGDEDLDATEKAAKEEVAKAEQEIKERADEAARLVAQKAQEDAVLKAKKLAAEKLQLSLRRNKLQRKQKNVQNTQNELQVDKLQ